MVWGREASGCHTPVTAAAPKVAELLRALQSMCCLVDGKNTLSFWGIRHRGRRALPYSGGFISADFLILNINFSVLRENNFLSLAGQVFLNSA